MPQRMAAELQALVAETRRKYPDVKQAAEQLLQQWQTDAARTTTELQTSRDHATHALLQMIVLACDTRAPKVIQMSLSLLQRSIPPRLFPDSALPTIVDTLHKLLSAPGRADVEVQLKILQTVSVLLATYASVTSTLLSRALMLCFTLYEHSRVAVVSSTAAATLRQDIMMVFDKVHEEDQFFDSIATEDAAATAPLPAHTAQLPSGPITLFPFAADAYQLLNDLCALADGQAAEFLPLQTLSKPFVLELLESVLTSQAALLTHTRHPELVYVLRSAACPFLLKALSEAPSSFSVYIRIVRLVRLLLLEFSEEVILEVEMLLRALLDTCDEKHALWQRVLAWETIDALCADRIFIERVWNSFDGRTDVPPETSHRPASSPMSVDVPSPTSMQAHLPVSPSPPRICVLQSVVKHVQQNARKARTVLQIDDALAAALEQRPDVPPSPMRRSVSNTFYDAAVAGVRSAAEGLLSTKAEEPLVGTSVPAIPLLDQLDKTETPLVGSQALPTTYLPYLILQALVHVAHALAVVPMPQQADMLSAYMRAINEGLTVFLTVQGSDAFFEQTLQALAHLAHAAGVAACTKERDLVLATLCDIAVPSAAYSGQALAPRNLAAQAALAYVCEALGSRLDMRWRALLQCVCQALVCLRKSDESAQMPAETPWFAEHLRLSVGAMHWLTPDTLDRLPCLLRGVFVSAAKLDDAALDTFACVYVDLVMDRVHEAHVSNELAHVMLVQVERFVRTSAARIAARMPSGPWLSIQKLLRLMSDENVDAVRRTTTAHIWDAAMYAIWSVLPMEAHQQQRWVLEALAQQGILDRRVQAGDVHVRHAAISTVYKVLETHAHVLRDGWEHVFDMCEAAAQDASDIRAAGLSPVPCLRSAFACIQLVCTSHLNTLKEADLMRCINALPSFSRQTEDVAMALKANGTLWDLTESIEQRDRTHTPELWLVLLRRLRDVAQVPNENVAECALANLFQVLVQYHKSFDLHEWQRVLTDVLLPLVEAEQVQPRAFQGTARVMAMVPPLRADVAWPTMWTRWLTAVERAVRERQDQLDVVHAALEALHATLRVQEQHAWWHDTWPTVVRLCDVHASMTLSDLCFLVDMLHMLFVHRPCTDTNVDAMLHALHECIAHGLHVADALSLSHLHRLVKRVQESFEFMTHKGATRAKVLDALQVCASMAYDAATMHSKHARMHAMYMELVREWLRQWLCTLDTHSHSMNECAASVTAMLHMLQRPLQMTPVPNVPNVWHAASDTLVSIARRGVDACASDTPLVSAFWHALFACMATALCADARIAPTDDDDACAMRLLASIECVLPYAGTHHGAHDALHAFLPSLVSATHLYAARGTFTRPSEPIHRERFAYATWDMLFRLVSSSATPGAKMVAAHLLPLIIERCRCVLQAYLDDVRIRGSIPLPRVRLEEVNFLLHTLLTLQVPSEVNEHCQHSFAQDAHLFLLGKVLDEIATMPATSCAVSQKACIGTSLPPLSSADDGYVSTQSIRRRHSCPTTPQALAAAALTRRMHVLVT